jgi:predicted MFS family arabinose efflux permease
VLLATALGAALGHVLTALALVVESYGLFILARFATGLLGGNGSVVRAMLAERLKGAQRVRAMAWLNSAFYLGWLGGPLLAALTIGFGLSMPFLIASGALMLSAALVAAVVPRQGASVHTSSWWQVARDGHVLHLLRHKPLRMLFIIQLGYSSGVGAFYEFYPLWLVETARFGTAGIAWTTAAMCALMTLSSVFAGRLSPQDPLQRAAWYAALVAAAVAVVAFGNSQVGIAAIVLFGIPQACYSAIIPAWCAERFALYGQGAVMGLLSTTFCLATILMALAGSVLTLIDTRLILLLGAALAGWAGWRLHGWRTQMAHPSTLAGTPP